MSENFGRYTLIERLGYGGMAEVFLAQTQGVGGFEKLLAIKRLLPHCIEDQQTVDLLADEARITVQLTHPHIVQVFDFGRVGESYFIAMEYVDGVDLKSLIQIDDEHSHPLPRDVALHVVISALEGLDFAHKRKDEKGEAMGIIHRDVSPHNLLISRHGQVKLTDFGVARARISSHVSVVGDIRGKFSYMPPEQAVGGEIDQRVDVFAAGAILYELLSGQQPYRSTSSGEQIKLLTGKIAPPSQIEPDVPTSLDEITLKALAKDPAQRYSSANELAEALRREFGRLVDASRLSAQQRLASMVERRAAENEREKELEGSSRLMVSINEHDKTFGDSLIFEPSEASGEVATKEQIKLPKMRGAPSVSFGDAILAEAASVVSRSSREGDATEISPVDSEGGLAHARTQLFERHGVASHAEASRDNETVRQMGPDDHPLVEREDDSTPMADEPTRVEPPRQGRPSFIAGLASGEIETVVQSSSRSSVAQIDTDPSDEDDYEATTLQERADDQEAHFGATVEMDSEVVRAAQQEAIRQREPREPQPRAAARPRTKRPTASEGSAREARPVKAKKSTGKNGKAPLPAVDWAPGAKVIHDELPPAVQSAVKRQHKLNRQHELISAYITIAIAVAVGLFVAIIIATW